MVQDREIVAMEDSWEIIAMLYFRGHYFTMESIPWNCHGKRFPWWFQR